MATTALVGFVGLVGLGAEPVVAAVVLAVDDLLSGNPVGDRVVVDVLLNDDAAAVPSTLALVDPVSGDQGDEVVVVGEGTWSVVTPWSTELWRRPPSVQFDPEPGLVADPTPIEYAVADVNGNVGRATVAVGYQDLARSDVSLDHPVDGATIAIDVLSNDDQSVGNPCIAPPDRELLQPGVSGRCWIDYPVYGEGVWEPRIDGTVEFLPDQGFRGNPTPMQYSVVDADDTAYFATMTISYSGLDPDDTLLNNPAGGEVSIDVLGNDPIGFDADTLMLVDPVSGDPTTALTIEGEGVWAVGLDRRVTFTPDMGFQGDPTPMAYSVGYPSGDTAGAVVTLTFQSLIRNDCSLGNLRGREVAIDVLDNDDESLRFETLALSGALRERRLPGQTRQEWHRDEYYRFRNGTWIVDARNLRIVYDPDNTANLAPTPQEYSVLDADGVEHFGTVTVTYDGAETPPESACGVLATAPTTTTTVPPTTVPVTTTASVTELPATGGSMALALELAGVLAALGAFLARFGDSRA